MGQGVFRESFRTEHALGHQVVALGAACDLSPGVDPALDEAVGWPDGEKVPVNLSPARREREVIETAMPHDAKAPGYPFSRPGPASDLACISQRFRRRLHRGRAAG